MPAAATTVYSSYFDSNGKPTGGRPLRNPGGAAVVDAITYTMATTQLDYAADFTGLIPVPFGATLLNLSFDSADFDTSGSPALDMDIILRTYTSAGAAVDTILLNAGTLFQGAVTNKKVFLNAVTVPEGLGRYGIIGLYVNTAAATPAAVDISLEATWR